MHGGGGLAPQHRLQAMVDELAEVDQHHALEQQALEALGELGGQQALDAEMLVQPARDAEDDAEADGGLGRLLVAGKPADLGGVAEPACTLDQ
jgi:Uncharacterized iron-regulated protein